MAITSTLMDEVGGNGKRENKIIRVHVPLLVLKFIRKILLCDSQHGV
jgi:hypothetical protein